MKATLYEILGVQEDATLDAIENAHRNIERHRRELIADPNNEEALNRAKFAHQASAILSNPASRARYDEQLRLQRVRQNSPDGPAVPPPAEQAAPRAVEMVASADPHPEDVIAWTPSVPEATSRETSISRTSDPEPASKFTLPWMIGLGLAGILVFSVLMMTTIGKYSGSSSHVSSQPKVHDARSSEKSVEEPAQAAIRDTAIAAVQAQLIDPYSAQFDSLYHLPGATTEGRPVTIVCGQVNAKNRFGGYIGSKRWIYMDGEAYIDGADSDTGSLVARMYLRLCDTSDKNREYLPKSQH